MSSEAGSFSAQPWPWESEKAPSPLDPGSLCSGGGTGQCLEFTGSMVGTCLQGPPRSKIRTKWQETQVCPWLPGWGQREKLRSLLVVPLLPIVTGSMSLLACSLPSQGPAVLTFPPQCSFGSLISGARSPPRCSLCGGQPSSLGISCHCGPEPRHCRLPGQLQSSGSLPGPQVGPRSPERLGKLAKAPRSPAWQTGHGAQDT